MSNSTSGLIYMDEVIQNTLAAQLNTLHLSGMIDKGTPTGLQEGKQPSKAKTWRASQALSPVDPDQAFLDTHPESDSRLLDRKSKTGKDTDSRWAAV